MSEDENFLARWSRRKREAAEQESATPPADARSEPTEPESPEAAAAAPKESAPAEIQDEPKFDLSSLPPIDAIGPDTDIRPFLRPGVPTDLTRAALRRAWSVTPGIRDYIGPSENSWDFTAAGPDGVPGFDFGDPGVDVRRLAAQLFGGEETPEPSPPVSTVEKIAEPPAEPPPAVTTAVAPDHDILRSEATAVPEVRGDVPEQALTASHHASQGPPEATPAEFQDRVRRRHGGALPS